MDLATGLPEPGDLVVAAGAGVTGLPVVRWLAARGCRVAVTSDREVPAAVTDLPGDITVLGDATAPPPGTALVVMSAGIPPHRPLPVAAAAAGVPVIGEVELAWRLDQASGRPRPWLVVTGTNGKTTTVGMLEAALRAGGLEATACGNVGWPVLEAVTADGEPVSAGTDEAQRRRARQDVIAVELSSFMLERAPSLRPRAGAVLNLAEDHLDWHGTMAAYAAAKARALTGEIAVAVVDDPGAAQLLLASPAPRRIAVTAGRPTSGRVGVDARTGWITDRALGGGALFRPDDLTVSGTHQLTNAMAAAALARAVGVAPPAIRLGLSLFRVGGHRAAAVAERDGVAFVDDSKATNPHAALASLTAHRCIVWIAGGQLKGASVDHLVVAVRDRLAGVVLLGVDAPAISAALARHAPDVPRITVARTDDGAMDEVVTAAWQLAQRARDAGTPPTVLLAPAAASLDMFGSYAARGDAFAAAARRIAGRDR